MKPKWMPKPGDKINVEGFTSTGRWLQKSRGVIKSLGSNGCVTVFIPSKEISYLFHIRNCRLLKKKTIEKCPSLNLKAWLTRTTPIFNDYSPIFKPPHFVPPVPSTTEYIRAPWLDPPS